ncbi:unnamed protein product [Enterobius vermicularis]|uniref:Uncharacterized protein n=1 Tax=Enterobius vermicularis TaxID=51028 RepID=A0A0N4UTB6_ENTVE|nr:unnamed protein product [Enterobius vermicularis]
MSTDLGGTGGGGGRNNLVSELPLLILSRNQFLVCALVMQCNFIFDYVNRNSEQLSPPCSSSKSDSPFS